MKWKTLTLEGNTTLVHIIINNNKSISLYLFTSAGEIVPVPKHEGVGRMWR